MTRSPLIFLALAALCFLGALLWSGRGAGGYARPVAAEEALGAPADALPHPPAPPGAAQDSPEAAASDLSAVREAVAHETATAALSITLQGTAVAHTADGAEYAREDGNFWISFDLTGRAQAVAVRNGRWETMMELPEQTAVTSLGRASISRVILRSRRGDPFPETIVLAVDRELVVGCRWSANNLLHVLDAESGAHLAGVRLLPASAGRLPPASAEGREPGETSPFVFEPGLGSLGGNDVRAWWVGAPGHEWARIALDHRRGGDRTLTLRPAGELQITWTGEPPSGPVLEIQPLDGPLAGQRVGQQLLSGGPPMLFSGLAPGRYEVNLRRMRRSGRLLLSREAAVRAGERTALRLNLEPLAHAPEPVPLGGTIQVHSGWRGMGKLSLEVRRDDPTGALAWGTATTDRHTHALGEVTAEEGAGDVRPWKAEDVLPGRVRIDVLGPGGSLLLREPVDVGRAGAEGVVLRVDEPALVAIDVREGSTGRRFLRGASSPGQRGLNISCRPAGSSASYEEVCGEVDEDTGVFQARLPRGEWELSIFHQDFAWIRERLSLGSSSKSLTVTLQGSCTIDLRLMSEGWTVPVELKYWRAIEVTDADSEELPFGIEMVGNRPGHARLTMEDRGRCRLILPQVNGFSRSPPIHVTLSPGEPTVVEVEFERLFSRPSGQPERR